MTMHCPCTGINIPRFLVTVVIGFAFVFAYDFLVHGILLLDQYEETAHIWRSKPDMEAHFPWAIACQFLLVMALAFIFTRHYEEKGLGEGLRFGLALGVLLGIVGFGMYPYLPISFGLAAFWFLASLIQVTGLGVIFALFYRK